VETLESVLLLGRQAVLTLGASELEADGVTDEVRKCDAERFALETSGGPFSRRALTRANIERSDPPKRKPGMLSEHCSGSGRPVAVDPLAVSRCLAGVGTGDLTTHRPQDLLQTP
jgi:hypothetical protein